MKSGQFKKTDNYTIFRSWRNLYGTILRSKDNKGLGLKLITKQGISKKKTKLLNLKHPFKSYGWHASKKYIQVNFHNLCCWKSVKSF